MAEEVPVKFKLKKSRVSKKDNNKAKKRNTQWPCREKGNTMRPTGLEGNGTARFLRILREKNTCRTLARPCEEARARWKAARRGGKDKRKRPCQAQTKSACKKTKKSGKRLNWGDAGKEKQKTNEAFLGNGEPRKQRWDSAVQLRTTREKGRAGGTANDKAGGAQRNRNASLFDTRKKALVGRVERRGEDSAR